MQDAVFHYPSKLIGPEKVDTVHRLLELLDGWPFEILGRHTNLESERRMVNKILSSRFLNLPLWANFYNSTDLSLLLLLTF